MSGAIARRERWDLFCRVVDNYGDIGIAWRLARQLAAHVAVRLVVDRLDVFARIEPCVDAGLDEQEVDGIAIARWSIFDARPMHVADVVVELLGCGLPPRHLDAMARNAAMSPVVWIDFEHLSAEAWVDDFHGLPSPHPTLPLTKHFFYPGFGPRTGGLLIEPGIEARRKAFLASPDDVTDLWRRLGVPAPKANERRLLVFAYAHAPLDGLLQVLAKTGTHRWTVLVPGGTARESGHVHAIPFVDQDDFDRLLWLCDANIVRGEDSFVRAQLAGRPFVWHIYRQPDAVHLGKLAAFEDIHEAGMPPAVARAQHAMWRGWNERVDELPAALDHWLAALPELQRHAELWRARLLSEPPLIDRLLTFVGALRGPPDAARGLLD